MLTHCAIEPDPVNYEDLTSWIAAEKGVTSVPEALTKGQRKALATSKLPPLEEPVIGDTDWISLLMSESEVLMVFSCTLDCLSL